MSKLADRENKRKSSVVQDIVSVQAEDKREEKKDIIARTFYIGAEHVKALAFEKAETGKDLSEIVREALNDYFGDKIEKYR